MVELIHGDLFESPAKYLCHQCNSVTQRGAHLAKAMFERYPWADIYSPRIAKDRSELPLPGETPGNIIVRGDGEGQRYVINLIGQYYPGKCKYPNSKRDGYDARLGYFRSCLMKIADIPNLHSIVFPWRIGCGAAGGDWGQYLSSIRTFSEHVDAKVSVCCLDGKFE